MTDDEPCTPAEMASVLLEATELLDGVLDSIAEARHGYGLQANIDTLDEVHERVRAAWAGVTVARTSLVNLERRDTLHRIVGLTE